MYSLVKQVITNFAATPSTEEYDPNDYLFDIDTSNDGSLWAGSIIIILSNLLY